MFSLGLLDTQEPPSRGRQSPVVLVATDVVGWLSLAAGEIDGAGAWMTMPLPPTRVIELA